jgi:hypothetical protein
MIKHLVLDEVVGDLSAETVDVTSVDQVVKASIEAA